MPELELVALRMRMTLAEVLGPETGRDMYSMEWLVKRVLWHLDCDSCTGAVFVSEGIDRRITGHTIVRIERDEDGAEFGLFSTTYVDQAFRRQAIATYLLARGEQWMVRHGMRQAATYTHRKNEKLIQLYLKHGYEKSVMPRDFVRLSRPLP